ncbi:MAG: glutamate--tRNA ligase, partial [Mesorhizobium sp.]
LTAEQIAEYQADGRRPHWRFLLPNFTSDPLQPERTEIRWNDLVRGEETVDLASLSDPVLMREDGTYLYTLPSVVDDIE